MATKVTVIASWRLGVLPGGVATMASKPVVVTPFRRIAAGPSVSPEGASTTIGGSAKAALKEALIHSPLRTVTSPTSRLGVPANVLVVVVVVVVVNIPTVKALDQARMLAASPTCERSESQ